MSELKETVPSDELLVNASAEDASADDASAENAASEVTATQVENSSETSVVASDPEAQDGQEPKSMLASVTEAVTSAVAAVTTSVTAAVKPAVEAVVEAVSNVVENVKAETEPVVEQAVEAAAEAVEAVAEPVAEAVTEAAEAVEVAVEPIVEPIAEAVTGAVDAVVEPVAAMVENAVEAAAEPVTEPATEPVAEVGADESAADDGAGVESEVVEHTDASGKRVVKTLAVGQEVQGTVKRVSEFGAFVDIGVGRDGLVHISELSVRRVGKVTDVLKEGDAVTLWIKKLDRERNRISLTMIAPGTRTMRDLNKDDLVTGTVTRILPYGAFIDIGVGRDALLHVREMGERYVAKPEEVVKVGESVEARIIDIQRRRGRIDLSIKGLREEPEPEPLPQAPAREFHAGPRGDRVRPEPEPQVSEPEPPDQFADVEVVSPMELALRKAMEESGVEFKITRNDKRDKKDKRRYRDEQEDIFARTLKAGK